MARPECLVRWDVAMHGSESLDAAREQAAGGSGSSAAQPKSTASATYRRNRARRVLEWVSYANELCADGERGQSLAKPSP